MHDPARHRVGQLAEKTFRIFGRSETPREACNFFIGCLVGDSRQRRNHRAGSCWRFQPSPGLARVFFELFVYRRR